MWHTPSGTRYLQGAEAVLAKTAIGVMVDNLEEEIRHPDNSWTCGVRIFDTMDARQKLALLATVTNALLRPDVPEPPLNAINEGAIAAIFESLPVYVEIEIDGQDSDWSDYPEMDLYSWRRLILEAAKTDGTSGDFEFPTEDCRDKGKWDLLIGCLADQILWDDDWADEEIQDADPDAAVAHKDRMGIDDDYYLDVAPDPTDKKLAEARQILKALLGEAGAP